MGTRSNIEESEELLAAFNRLLEVRGHDAGQIQSNSVVGNLLLAFVTWTNEKVELMREDMFKEIEDDLLNGDMERLEHAGLRLLTRHQERLKAASEGG